MCLCVYHVVLAQVSVFQKLQVTNLSHLLCVVFRRAAMLSNFETFVTFSSCFSVNFPFILSFARFQNSNLAQII